MSVYLYKCRACQMEFMYFPTLVCPYCNNRKLEQLGRVQNHHTTVEEVKEE